MPSRRTAERQVVERCTRMKHRALLITVYMKSCDCEYAREPFRRVELWSASSPLFVTMRASRWSDATISPPAKPAPSEVCVNRMKHNQRRTLRYHRDRWFELAPAMDAAPSLPSHLPVRRAYSTALKAIPSMAINLDAAPSMSTVCSTAQPRRRKPARTTTE